MFILLYAVNLDVLSKDLLKTVVRTIDTASVLIVPKRYVIKIDGSIGMLTNV